MDDYGSLRRITSTTRAPRVTLIVKARLSWIKPRVPKVLRSNFIEKLHVSGDW